MSGIRIGAKTWLNAHAISGDPVGSELAKRIA